MGNSGQTEYKDISDETEIFVYLQMMCSYSVYISEEQITLGTSIEAELLKFSEDEIEQMRETIVSFIPKLLYARHSHAAGFQSVQGDAFDTTLEGVLQKVARYKEQLNLS
jgi:hypothetical protein